ncbi:MAG: hypothetical protein CMO01_00370 [Thalassobius sp.]|nr:hypothetical protein [Thalassovita sp.]
MKKISLSGVAAVIATGIVPQAHAQTSWIQDTITEQCSTESRQQVADGVRGSIEASVARSEASIKPPASVGDLSCMSDLLKADVDVFSESWMDLGSFDVEGMINDVTGGLKSGLSVQTLSSGVERAICDFAEEKFEEVTGGIDGSMDDILAGAEQPSFSDGFGLLNIGYNSGGSGSSGSVGSGNGGTYTPTFDPDNGGNGSGETYTPFVEPSENSGSETEQQIQSIWNNISGGSN